MRFSADENAAGMETTNRKVLVLVLVLLLVQIPSEAHSVSECCRQPGSCRLSVLLCGSGSRGVAGTLIRDASAGILTLGKRAEDEHRLQNRLQQLLHGSRNQAAGILTVGKRTGAWGDRTGTATPLPV